MAAIPGGVGAAFTRKIGPLPAWGWGVGIGGVLLAVKLARGGGIGHGGGKDRETVLVPTGQPSIPSDYIGQLGTAIDEIRSRLSNMENNVPITTPPPTAPPANGNPVEQPSAAPTLPVSAKPIPYAQLGEYVIGLRAKYPVLHSAWIAATGLKPGIPGVYPGETDTQREARLRAEARFFETGALGIPAPSPGSVNV